MWPTGLCRLVFFSVVAFCWVPAGCYSNGKVTKVCGSMEPHHSASGQTKPSPYKLSTNTTIFSPGDHIQVTLSGTTFFEGFLLEARDAGDQASVSAVGSFILTDPSKTQLLTCNKQQDSAVSHTSDVKQTEVVVIWEAPRDSPKEVQFFVTVVTHYNVFWVKQSGPVIYQHGVTPHPPHSTTTSTPPHTTTPSILPGPFSSDGCGGSKTCLLDPPGCDPKDDPHCFFLSMTPQGHDKSSVMFELSGPADGYVSFALSWDRWMGDDDVYLCISDGHSVSVSAAFAAGRKYPEDQTQSDLHDKSWRLADGVIQCKFSRPVIPTTMDSQRFHLDRQYYLFLADGHADNGAIWKHKRHPLVSEKKILITGSFSVLRGYRGPVSMKVHGGLMLFAWMLTGSVGTFIASFYKPDWPDRTLMGQKIWFQIHRCLMMVTVILTILAFWLPFFYRGGWSKHAGVHPYLGCCVLALALLQPIMARFRPAPTADRRYIFNWAHWGVGSITEIMAVAAMFLGMRQSSLLLPSPWATRIMIGYVTWLGSFRFLFLMHKHFYKKCTARSDDQQPIVSDQSEPNSTGSIIKSLLLAALALGNAGFLVALLHSVAEI